MKRSDRPLKEVPQPPFALMCNGAVPSFWMSKEKLTPFGPRHMGSIVAVVAILGGTISDCLKTVARTDLKRSMVERGYTVEQIDHVLTDKRM